MPGTGSTATAQPWAIGAPAQGRTLRLRRSRSVKRAGGGQVAWLLDPIAEGVHRHVFAAEKIHGDDTTVPVQEPGLGRTKTGRLWVYVATTVRRISELMPWTTEPILTPAGNTI